MAWFARNCVTNDPTEFAFVRSNESTPSTFRFKS